MKYLISVIVVLFPLSAISLEGEKFVFTSCAQAKAYKEYFLSLGIVKLDDFFSLCQPTPNDVLEKNQQDYSFSDCDLAKSQIAEDLKNGEYLKYQEKYGSVATKSKYSCPPPYKMEGSDKKWVIKSEISNSISPNRWEYLTETESTIVYKSKEEISKKSKQVISTWFFFTYTDSFLHLNSKYQSAHQQYYINCESKESSLVQTIIHEKFNGNGAAVTSFTADFTKLIFNESAPGTIGELMITSVCDTYKKYPNKSPKSQLQKML